MIVVEICAGVALALFGVRFLRKGLDRLFGGKLVPWIARMTLSRIRGFAAGICAGVVAPSSTAMALLAAQLLHMGKFGADRMLATLLGTGVGVTVMVQLLAFRITDHAGWFLVIGVVMFQFLQRGVLRGIGQCLLSLGFIFLAMRIIGGAAVQISLIPEWVQFFGLVERVPFVVFLATTLLAVLMQSSTAAIAFGLALAAGGVMSPLLMATWILGTNVGLAITTLAAGWRDTEGRRLGTANLLLKGGFALPLVLLPGLGVAIFEAMPGSFAREAAMFHTVFNLAVGLAALPVLAHISRIVAWMVPDSQTAATTTADGPTRESYLDPRVLDTPSLAIAGATRETLRMADEVRWMLEGFYSAMENSDRQLLLRVRERDDRVDVMNGALTDYLSHLTDGLSDDDARWQLALLQFSNELESVGDLIDKQLGDALAKRIERKETLGEADRGDVRELYRQVTTRFDQAVALLTTRDATAAKPFLDGKEALNTWCRDIQLRHYGRLAHEPETSTASSLFFLELLNGFRRINSHITTIGYLVGQRGRRRTASPRQG